MSPTVKTTFRVGTGYDFHPFEEGGTLVLGGVQIPYPQGLKGHSDADALLHALMDALLGAAGMSDLGGYFPDSDARYETSQAFCFWRRFTGWCEARVFRWETSTSR